MEINKNIEETPFLIKENIEEVNDNIMNLTQEKEQENEVISIEKKYNYTIRKTFITTHSLNLREGADLQKPVLTIIPNNTEVKCTGYYINDWYEVEYNSYKGFCLKTYLK